MYLCQLSCKGHNRNHLSLPPCRDCQIQIYCQILEYVSCQGTFLQILKVLLLYQEVVHMHEEVETKINIYLQKVKKMLCVVNVCLLVKNHSKQLLVRCQINLVLAHQTFHSHNREGWALHIEAQCQASIQTSYLVSESNLT